MYGATWQYNFTEIRILDMLSGRLGTDYRFWGCEFTCNGVLAMQSVTKMNVWNKWLITVLNFRKYYFARVSQNVLLPWPALDNTRHAPIPAKQHQSFNFFSFLVSLVPSSRSWRKICQILTVVKKNPKLAPWTLIVQILEYQWSFIRDIISYAPSIK